MSRGLTSGMQTAFAAATAFPIFFIECDFSTGNVYVWNGQGNLSWNSITWTGVGDFMGIDKVSEDSQVVARGIKLTLNGVPTAAISEAMVSNYRGRACKVWLGAFNSSGAIVADPQQIFGGRMDQMTINDSGESCTIDLTVESRLIDLQRQRERRYTNQDQQFFYPGDTGLQYVAGLQDQPIYWGQATPTAATTNASASNVPTGQNLTQRNQA